MIVLLALHMVLGLGIVAVGERLGRRALRLGALAPLATTIWLILVAGDVLDGEVLTEHVDWVPSLGLGVDLRLDGFAALMTALVAGIGVLVMAYGTRYFGADTPRVGRLAGLLTVFAGAMLGVVWADNVLALYTAWELTSITSYLLIGNDHTEPKARAAALHALMITVAGGLAMLGGFVVLAQSAGTYSLTGILAAHPQGTGVSLGLGLVLLGVLTKSAQYPFHGWLPGAMAAPTPVSAYLHSATMVKAGIYLLARLAPVFAVAGFWRPTVTAVGVVTMVGGGLRALRQQDLKLLLAFGTVSQLGFMLVLFGLGTPEAVQAGCLLLLVHGAFKAALFMVVGVVDHETGTRDLRELPVLGRGWGLTHAVAIVSAASMAGIPLVAGFVSKEAAYAGVLDSGLAGRELVVAGIVAGSALTFAYTGRLLWGLLVAPGRRQAAPAAHAPSLAFVAPALVLAVATVAVGLVPSTVDDLVSAAGGSLTAAADHAHLALWHGFGAPLVLSAVTIAAGIGLFVVRIPLARRLAVGDRIPGGSDAYLAVLRALNVVATRATGVVQNGSLPIYTAVILLTAAVLPAGALVLHGAWPSWPDLVDTPAHVPVAALILGSALAAATNRRRVSAVLFLGVTGYAMAALYVVQGAPDLALTTVAIETLSTVLFVLVLRHLPVRFERRATNQQRVLRLVASVTIGVAVFVVALAAGTSRTADPVSDEMVARSLPDGHGRNVVNVILVDFRGFDTMGEITVLASAAIGAVALARAGRRPRHLEDEVATEEVR